jgi:hypothetical protein
LSTVSSGPVANDPFRYADFERKVGGGGGPTEEMFRHGCIKRTETKRDFVETAEHVLERGNL